MGCCCCCCFCPSFSSTSKSPPSHVYLSPLPKPQLSDAQLPAAAQPQVHQVANSQAEEILNGDGITLKVTFVKDEANEDAHSNLKSLEADSKQSSGEGESYESLFSLQLVDGWSTANEEEVMSKEISSKSNTSMHLFEQLKEEEEEEARFPTAIESKGKNDEGMDKTNEALRGESEEVSVVSSLSSWLVDDVEPENIADTPMSCKDLINQKPNGVSGKRRVLGELGLLENNANLDKVSKAQAAADSNDVSSIQISIKQEIRRSIVPKEDQKIDLQKGLYHWG